MDLEHSRDAAARIALVATGEVPHDGDGERHELLEHDSIAEAELLGREPAAERIVDVGIGAGLIKDHVAVAHRPHDARKVGEEPLDVARVLVLRASREVMHGAVRTSSVEDGVGAVAIVHVAVEDTDSRREPLGAKRERGDREAVEGAEAGSGARPGVVKAGARGADDAALPARVAGGREHRPGRVRERRRDIERALAEAVVGVTGEDGVDPRSIVGEGELVMGGGLRFVEIERQVPRRPGGDDESRLVGTRGVRPRASEHLRRVENGEVHAVQGRDSPRTHHARITWYTYWMVMNDPFSRAGLSIDRLRSFLAVADAGAISRAAPSDPVRQSQLSRQIGELEQFFGRPLVERKGRGIMLTPAGEELAVVVRSALAGIRDVATGDEGPLVVSLGAGDSLLHAWVIPRLSRFSRQENITLTLAALAVADVAERLLDGRLDLGVLRSRELPSGMRTRPLGTIDYALYVPRALRRKASRSLETLAHVPYVVQNGEPELRAKLEAALARAGVQTPPALVCETFPQAQRAVATGSYAGVLPTLARPDLPASRFDEHRDPALASLSSELRLAWTSRLERQRPRVARWLGKLGDALAHAE